MTSHYEPTTHVLRRAITECDGTLSGSQVVTQPTNKVYTMLWARQDNGITIYGAAHTEQRDAEFEMAEALYRGFDR